jgi:succinate dehydrogenase / fumarate reductase, iron-sulfur subunit
MDVTIKIRRFNPEQDKRPSWGTYTLTNCNKTDRVLDMLHRVKAEIDGTLTLRRSCAQGIYGSDAMRINGRNRLACKVLISEFKEGQPIQVEPILGLRVIKDLVVDMVLRALSFGHALYDQRQRTAEGCDRPRTGAPANHRRP